MSKQTGSILIALILTLSMLGTAPPHKHVGIQRELEQLARRGITHRFLQPDLIEFREEWSGRTWFKSLREPGEGEIRAWAAARGVPILEIDPAQIDTNQYNGWYQYWIDVPLANGLGSPVVVDDIDRDGKADIYGTFRDFTSNDFEAHVHEVDSTGKMEFGFNYVPRPGVSRETGDVDQDSLREVLFTFGGGVYNYEQAHRDSLPVNLRFVHERYEGNTSPGVTDIHVGFLDSDNRMDLLYKGTELDSADSTVVVARIYVAEYESDSLNFIRVWSTTYVLGWQGGISGFAVDDFDGDGKTEFAVCDLLSGKIFVTKNIADNDFSTVWQDSTPFTNLSYLTHGDVDNDGRPEFFVGATMSDGNWTLVYEADSTDSYSLQFIFHSYSGGIFDSPIYLTKDIDHDGKNDFVLFSGPYLHVFRAHGDNDYRLQYLKYEPERLAVQFYDFNRDGIEDFLIGRNAFDSLGQWRRYSSIYLGTPLVHVTEEKNQQHGPPSLENYPNPFNNSTTIRFTLPNVQRINLRVFDILGRQVSLLANETRSAGRHEIPWDASGVASGIYMIRLEMKEQTITKKVVIQK